MWNFIPSFPGRSEREQKSMTASFSHSVSVELPRAMCSRKQFERRDKGTNSRTMQEPKVPSVTKPQP